ncbi:MAG: carbohydrate ABC transporter permease [Muribaculaceae bacterium]|nr:carbohydrate ABC transporter permease [Muribaculaceae bacterium]
MEGRVGKLKISDIVIFVVLLLSAVLCIVPIWNTICISFSDRAAVNQGIVSFWPVNFTAAAYRSMLSDSLFWHSFLVSVLRVIVGSALNILMCVMMGYPLSKSPKVFKGKQIYIWFLIFTMLFNGGMIPTYIVMRNLHLLDTFWALVLPGAVPIFNVILIMNFFKTLPPALEESAFLDGANPWQIMWKIYVPLSKPSIATVALFSMVAHWNSFMDGKLYITDKMKMPLQTYIQSLSASVSVNDMATLSADEIADRLSMSSLSFNSAKALVAIVPLLIIYPFLQRYFVSGIVVGAVKE